MVNPVASMSVSLLPQLFHCKASSLVRSNAVQNTVMVDTAFRVILYTCLMSVSTEHKYLHTICQCKDIYLHISPKMSFSPIFQVLSKSLAIYLTHWYSPWISEQFYIWPFFFQTKCMIMCATQSSAHCEDILMMSFRDFPEIGCNTAGIHFLSWKV